MFFKKKPNRLYIPTKTRWYKRPKRDTSHLNTRKIFTHNIRTHISRWMKDAFLYIVAGVVFIGMLIFILFSSKFSINDIEIARSNLHINNTAVSDLLKGYKGKSIFFFSKSEAVELIKETYPEFSQITIKKLLPDRIKVELETYGIVANMKAAYVLPEVGKKEDINELIGEESEEGEEKEASESPKVIDEKKEELTPVEQKALLNEIGQAIFGQEENLELMTIRIENLSQPIEDRQFAIRTPDMKYITDAVKYVTNLLELEVTSVSYFEIAREVHLTTENNLTLWLTTDKDYKKQIDKFNTVYKIAELDKEDIDYVDLRIDEKLIYCPRGATCDR